MRNLCLAQRLPLWGMETTWARVPAEQRSRIYLYITLV